MDSALLYDIQEEVQEASEDERFEEHSSSLAKIQLDESKVAKRSKSDILSFSKTNCLPIKKNVKVEKIDVIKQMIDTNCEMFETQRRFEKAQYHQCIPNPQIEGEMITVQLITPRLTQQAPDCSLDEMAKKVNRTKSQGAKLEEMYCNYHIRDQQYQLESIESNFQSDVKKRIGVQPNSDAITIKKEWPIINDSSDEVAEIQANLEMAIIGFWKAKKESSLFSCYRYFYVPCPMTRTVKFSDRTVKNKKSTTVGCRQTLFKGAQDEIFLFYDNDVKDRCIGILNLKQDNTSNMDKSLSTNRRSHLNMCNLLSFQIKDVDTASQIGTMHKQPSGMSQFQNPQIIRGFDKDADGENKDYVLVILLKLPKKVSKLVFYNLNEGKIVKRIEGAEVYLAHYRNNQKTFVKYMSHSCVLDLGLKASENSEHDLVVEHKLDSNQVEQKPDKGNALLTQLNFVEIDEKYSQNKKSKVLEAYLHNNDTRLTYVKEGKQAYTFELPKHDISLLELVQECSDNDSSELNTRKPKEEVQTKANDLQNDIFYPSYQTEPGVREEQTEPGVREEQTEPHVREEQFKSEEIETQNIPFQPQLTQKLSQAIMKRTITIKTTLQAQLKYYIESDDVRADTRRSGKDLDIFIMSNIRKNKNDEHRGEANTSTFYYNLYNVSDIQKTSLQKEKRKSYNRTQTKIYQDLSLTPQDCKKVIVSLNETFNNALDSQQKYFYMLMPLQFTTDKQDEAAIESDSVWKITGSALYEEIGTGEVILNFYTTKYDSVDTGETGIPQQPLQQLVHVNYPILAYKCMNPDNSTIAIVHLAQQIPQQHINLKSWEFVSFVGGHFKDPQLRKQIIFLVQDRRMPNYQKLMMIETEPWKRIDRQEEFFTHIKLHQFSGKVSQPDEGAAQMFSSDKIRDVQLIQNKVVKDSKNKQETLAALVMQFDHCLATTALVRGSHKMKECQFKIHSKLPQMVKEFAVRGIEGSIFFAQKNSNKDGRTSIYKLQFNPNFQNSIDTKVVYELNSRLVAIEMRNSADISAFQMTEESKDEMLYVLDDTRTMYQLKKKRMSEEYECIKSYNYHQHYLQDIMTHHWSKCHISSKAITYNNIIYRVQSSVTIVDKPAKTYFCYERKSFESETTNIKQTRTNYENWVVQGLNQTTGMLTIGREEKGKGTTFILQPDPGSRKTQLLAGDQVHLVTHKAFVTNNHILIQLKSTADQQQQTVVMKANGTVLPQSKEVREYLNQQIIGQSSLKNGKVFIVTRVQQPNGSQDLVSLRFSKNGIARTDTHIPEFLEKFRQLTKENIKIGVICDQAKKKLESQIQNLSGYKNAFECDDSKVKSPMLKGKPTILDVPSENQKIKGFITELQTIVDPDQREQNIIESQTFISKVLVTDDGRLIQVSSLALPENQCLKKLGQFRKYWQGESNEANNSIEAENEDLQVTIIPCGDKLIQVVFTETLEHTLNDIHSLFRFQFRLIGPYLCYRYYDDGTRIWIIKVVRDYAGMQPYVEMITPKRFINLELLLRKTDSKSQVEFDRVPTTSFLSVDERIDDQIIYYENLIQVSIRDETYIFNIADEDQDNERDSTFEVNFFHKLDQIKRPEHFVNTGTNQSSVIVSHERQNNYKSSKTVVLQTNEQVSYYFWEAKMSHCHQQDNMRKQKNESGVKSKPYVREYSGVLYRTHSYLDLLDLQYIQDSLRQNEDFVIEEDTILSTYQGHTIFSIFIEHLKVYQHILDQFKEVYEKQIHHGKDENPVFRRLYQILMMPVDDTNFPMDTQNFDYNCKICTSLGNSGKTRLSLRDRIVSSVVKLNTDCQCKGYFPVPQKSVHFTREKYRDVLIQISLMCKETDITMFINSLDDLNQLFVKINFRLNMLFERAFTSTRHCERIDTIESDNFNQFAVVSSNKSFIGAQELVQYMKQHSHKLRWRQKKAQDTTDSLHKTLVNVRMLRTKWLFKGSAGQEQNDLLNLMESIDRNPSSDEGTQTNEFLMAIIEAKWSLYRWSIIKFVFIPFAVNAILCLFLLPYLLPEYHTNLEQRKNNYKIEYSMKMLCYVLTIYNGGFEMIQLYDKKWLYLLQISNFFYIFSTLLNLLLLLMDDLYLEVWDDYPEKELVTIAVSLTWFKFFYWMRLFPSTAFFIDLMSKTFKDINFLAFLFFSFTLILTVASMFWVLNMGREGAVNNAGIQSSRLFPYAVDSEFFNAFFFTYIQVQGEYLYETFGGENSIFIWIIFFASTFLIQITLMNMLIAIMGNTFQQVLQNKQQSAMKERIKIISDFRLVLNILTPTQDAAFQYIFEVRPQLDKGDSGMVAAVKHSIEANAEKIISKQVQWTQLQNEKFVKLNNEVNEIKEDIQTIKAGIRGQSKLTQQLMRENQAREDKQTQCLQEILAHLNSSRKSAGN